MNIQFIGSIVALFLTLTGSVSQAIYTELGVSHSYKKTHIDENNFSESQSSTLSASFYVWSKSAIELSYTQAVSLREELLSDAEPVREIRQTAEVLGADFVFGFADRKATFQPYLKGGVAHISKKLRVQQGQVVDTTINPEPELVPSGGIGAKILLTDAFALKLSYDAWATNPSGEGTELDTAFSAGITWLF